MHQELMSQTCQSIYTIPGRCIQYTHATCFTYLCAYCHCK
jgi:hypothetical protein